MPTENFTIWSPGETDPGGDIDVAASQVTFTTLPRNVTAYHLDDKGVNHFSGDYEHKAELQDTSGDTNGIVFFWSLANVIDDWASADAGGADLHGVYSTSNRFHVQEVIAGSVIDDPSIVLSEDTPYYFIMKRDESIGVFGQLDIFIYSDSGRTNLLDTMTVTLGEKRDFRYIYGCQSFNDTNATTMSGYTKDLDLQEVVIGVSRSRIVNAGGVGSTTRGGLVNA